MSKFPKDNFNSYPDLHQHIENIQKAGLLTVIDRPINKDTELHPLVRWQFRGGIEEKNRKAFKFTNVTDSLGRSYNMPVVVGVLATNEEIYSIGMGVPVARIGETWENAINNPINPITIENARCQDVCITGDGLLGEGGGLDALPVPISTPGYDCAPYLTATNVTTRNPETGTQNMGTYRAGLKASNRLAIRMVARPGGAEGHIHWEMYKKLGQKMPCAIIVGCPPSVAYMGAQKLPIGVEEMAVAGGMAGTAIRQVKCKTVDIMVPAEAEIVIEGFVDTDFLEPEAPFAESHGHVALEDFNTSMTVTAITHRKDAIFTSIISQLTPSESSVIKRVAYEPIYLTHLSKTLGIKGIKKVYLHEPLTNLRKVLFIQFEQNVPTTEIWRALYGASSLASAIGKYVIAIDKDINPENSDSIFWAMAYRANPAIDIKILKHRVPYGPKDRRVPGGEDSTLLIDATLKNPMPPIALPKRNYMENAKVIWDELGLPNLKPETPWHGYSLGDWSDEWTETANRATDGLYKENGKISEKLKRNDVKPNSSIRDTKR
ncbi:MAG: carboxylase [Rhodospirillaceae bacterium]|nr:carboxylase [Rhodospirillaceae bacterium]OUT78327.1 MAG: carboxylase [Rhodospirillaceae bacterium TMED23]|tara:strand:- start:13427 stop:15067 length:1641 start_codon:yes stop_codon:yes gene_type:complete